MFFGVMFARQVRYKRNSLGSGLFVLLVLSLSTLCPSITFALPRRLVLGLDGVAYRDMRALQAGVTYTNFWGRRIHRQAFSSQEGYFPASRLISTFPSTSDVAWTDIYGDRPLPGYQRTYFSVAANSQIIINPITTTMEHESQMDFQLENGVFRTMGYIYPVHTYDMEVHKMISDFWKTTGKDGSYYVYIRASDDAQHLGRDIFAMLSMLDERLQKMRARYRQQEGRDLQILVLSDHGHNHATSAKRVEVGSFLQKAGYRLADSIDGPKDVVLPTTGIEDWVEIHNAPAATEALVPLLTGLEGVDLVTGRDPDHSNRFIVMNSTGERATIDWNSKNNTYRYAPEKGDPLGYLPVMDVLRKKGLLDSEGFATADVWMTATMTNRYPMALQRIARGLTRVTLNPATILISLQNDYVHCGKLLLKAASLSPFGSTHGALDSINSDGVVLSNFEPTHDTSSDRVAGLFGNFHGVNNFREEQSGAEFITRHEQSLVRIPRDAVARDYEVLPAHAIFLRVWSPELEHLPGDAPIETVIEKVKHFSSAQNRWAPKPKILGRHLTFNLPVSFPEKCDYERVYPVPTDLILKSCTEYRISGSIRNGDENVHLFEFNFHTDGQGRPAAY